MKILKRATLLTAMLLLLAVLMAFVSCGDDSTPAETIGGEVPTSTPTDTVPETEVGAAPESGDVTEEPTASEPGTDEPGTDEPGTDEPGADGSDTEEPNTEESATDESDTQEPDTEPPHEHTFGDWSEEKAATCTEKGSEKRVCACGESESREVPAKGHVEVTDAAVAPTCTETGLTEGKHCETCGAVIKAQEIVSAKGHVEVTDAAVAPTCTETGLTEGKHCETCGAVLVAQEIVAAKGHDFADRQCTVCFTYDASIGLTYTSLGNGTCYVSGMGTCSDTYVIIPEISPQGETVVGIGERAFANAAMTEIKIPDSITAIGAYAFENCALLVIVILPEGLTEVREGTFAGCTALESIRIPDSVTSLGDSAFADCDNLENVDMPEKLESIGNSAFENCHMLMIVILPEGLTSVGNSAFAGCTSLETVKLPDSLISVGDHAFKNCESLTALTLPAGLVLVGEGVIDGCKVLVYVYVVGDEIPDGVQEAVDRLLNERKEQGSDSGLDVERGGNNTHAFKPWVTVTAPTCTEIGLSERFCGVCSERETKELPAKGHVEVTDAAVAPTCTETGLTEGKHCEVCDTVLVAQEIVAALGHQYIGGYCERCGTRAPSQGLKFTSNGDGTCSVSGRGTCRDTEIVIPSVSPTGDLVTEVANKAFRDNGKIISVVIPDSVMIIGDQAFDNCDSLISVVISNSVMIIGDQAFRYSNSLSNISIPDSVTSIGDGAFAKCKITNILIPHSVVSIGIGAFNCDTLVSITVDNKNEVYYGNDNCIIDKTKKVLIAGCMNSKIPTDGSVTSIEDYAFSCTGLTSIEIPDEVTSIGDYAFYECKNLTQIIIHDSVVHIGKGAFSSCSKLLGIELPEGLTEISSSLFSSCSNLKSVIIPDGVTTIGASAFKYCSSLAEIIISDHVTTIGASAFAYCRGLKKVTIGEGVETMGADVFSNCVVLEELNINAVNLGHREGWFAFAGINGSGIKVTIGKQVTHLPDVFWYPQFSGQNSSPKITSVVFEEGSVCQSVSGLQELPKSVYNIYDNCYYLGTETNPYMIFVSAVDSSITSCDIHEDTKIIGASAFYRSNKLTNIVISGSVTSICSYAFSNCTSLASITFTGTMTQWESIAKGSNWNNNTGNYTVHCTDGDIPKSQS